MIGTTPPDSGSHLVSNEQFNQLFTMRRAGHLPGCSQQGFSMWAWSASTSPRESLPRSSLNDLALVQHDDLI